MKSALLILSICLIIACSPAVAPKTSFESKAQQNRVIYLKHSSSSYLTLNKYLKVVDIVTRRDDNGFYEAIVVLNNNRFERHKSDSPNLFCDVQFVFYDEDGIELEKTNWQAYAFPGGMDKAVKQISMDKYANDFKMYVREAKQAKW